MRSSKRRMKGTRSNSHAKWGCGEGYTRSGKRPGDSNPAKQFDPTLPSLGPIVKADELSRRRRVALIGRPTGKD